MPKANITYKAVGNDEKAEWGDYDHLINSQKLDDDKRNEVLKVALENVANTIKNK